jgi:hypothetical protein
MIPHASFTLDDFVKSPSAALRRFNFVVAAHLVSALHESPLLFRLCAPSPAYGGRDFYETILKITILTRRLKKGIIFSTAVEAKLSTPNGNRHRYP